MGKTTLLLPLILFFAGTQLWAETANRDHTLRLMLPPDASVPSSSRDDSTATHEITSRLRELRCDSDYPSVLILSPPDFAEISILLESADHCERIKNQVLESEISLVFSLLVALPIDLQADATGDLSGNSKTAWHALDASMVLLEGEPLEKQVPSDISIPDESFIQKPSSYRVAAVTHNKSEAFRNGLIEELGFEGLRKVGNTCGKGMKGMFRKGDTFKNGFNLGREKYEANLSLNLLRSLVKARTETLEKFDRQLQLGNRKKAVRHLINAENAQVKLLELQRYAEGRFQAAEMAYTPERFQQKIAELAAIRVFTKDHQGILDRRALMWDYSEHAQDLVQHRIHLDKYKMAGKISGIMGYTVIGLAFTVGIPFGVTTGLPMLAAAAIGVETFRGVAEAAIVVRTHVKLGKITTNGAAHRIKLEKQEERLRTGVRLITGIGIIGTAGAGTIAQAIEKNIFYSSFLGTVVGSDASYVGTTVKRLTEEAEGKKLKKPTGLIQGPSQI